MHQAHRDNLPSLSLMSLSDPSALRSRSLSLFDLACYSAIRYYPLSMTRNEHLSRLLRFR